MLKYFIMFVFSLLAAPFAVGEEPTQGEVVLSEVEAEPELETQAVEEVKTLSGMSILGNEEAPKSLVIIPWKSSEIGTDLGLSDTLDDRARPVDKEVFLRELSFYQIRAGE